MSSLAPELMRLHTTISAALPPMNIVTFPKSSSLYIKLLSSVGGVYVNPSAPPLRLTILSVSGRSVSGSKRPTAVATSACPTSCADTVRFSDMVNKLRFFSMPATVRSTAASNSLYPTFVFPARPASSAASFTKFSKSAPVKPAVICAMTSRPASAARGSARRLVCTARISLRPCLSGRSTETVRSKRPGRRSAASRLSGRFVAAMQITRDSVSNPSSSVRS
mmetsp:Transcript_3981/g.14455  ORF Transcript_3981/g.14455 Transcript_3981/m.14455 type:complete len:222 (+) Transcript_3981:2230-2895(+)